jgi:hypothetical protein
MRKSSVLALVVFAAWTADARAIDFKNVRATHGPFGTPRTSPKMLPGDVYLINFDIINLAIDPKNGGVKYVLTLDVFDPKGKQIIPEKDRISKKGVVVGLGGNSVPETVHVLLGADQAPGKYKVVVTVEDGSGTKASNKFTQDLEVLQADFGFIHILAPAMGFVGQDYVAEFSLVGMQRDSKKVPKVTITSRVLDESGKPTTIDPNISKIPEDLPADIKWEKQELVRMASPILLNRAGRFTVQIEAKDELSKKTVKFSYPLTVMEVGAK